MAHQTLSRHRRLRRLLRKTSNSVTSYVGNHALVAGVAGALIATAMAGLTLFTLQLGRADALDYARQTSQNLVSIVSSDLERNVEAYDLSLQSMVDSARDPVVSALPADLRRVVLFDRASTAGYLGGEYVIGPTGQVSASQNADIDAAVSLADRDYFLVHQRSSTVGLYFSHPFHPRLRDGKLSIGLTRRVDNANGEFAGVALLAIRVEYFQHLLDWIDTGRLGSVFIVMDDGTLLARKPFVERDIGTSIAKSPTFQEMAGHNAGTYVASVDGVRRIYTYARVPGTPLIATVAPAVDEVLAPWWHRSRITGLLTLTFGAIFVLVSWALAFALRDKQRAQAALVRLAATDPLTGLSNRRVLDNRLDEEWRRARRTGQPLSALFIDIDHFKRFNDAYGHAAGDEALIAVAECVSAKVRRSVDVVARYGGEEFAVLLPDTSAEGARVVAEKIRRKVQAQNVLQSDGKAIRVTVSIGCATSIPDHAANALDLLAAADRQLYAAKAAGRNRVCPALQTAQSVEQDSPS